MTSRRSRGRRPDTVSESSERYLVTCLKCRMTSRLTALWRWYNTVGKKLVAVEIEKQSVLVTLLG